MSIDRRLRVNQMVFKRMEAEQRKNNKDDTFYTEPISVSGFWVVLFISYVL